MSNEYLNRLIEKFISGVDVSIACANEIESCLDHYFEGDDEIADLIEILALYRPGGGEFLYDEKYVTEKLKHFLLRLTRKEGS
jgi:hypothetical protein